MLSMCVCICYWVFEYWVGEFVCVRGDWVCGRGGRVCGGGMLRVREAPASLPKCKCLFKDI